MSEQTESGGDGRGAPDSGREAFPVPYSAIVGQDRMKRALELAYVEPSIRGVLLTGERGTAKSTLVRAFAHALDIPMVTLPINATEDRVVGSWDIERLVRDKDDLVDRAGLIEQADGGILYIDEVNLLDDHIVNIILDVLASGRFAREHEGSTRHCESRFTLVGTMNPEEGDLRPQLLDRFDLYVEVYAETERRLDVLKQMVTLDAALAAERRGEKPDLLKRLRDEDEKRRTVLEEARKACQGLEPREDVLAACAGVAEELGAAGHRGERVLALALKASAAIKQESVVSTRDLRALAAPAFQHRTRPGEAGWQAALEKAVDKVLGDAAARS